MATVVVEVLQSTFGYRAQDPNQDWGLHTSSTTRRLSPGEDGVILVSDP